jgi:hypothetical protein
VVTIESEPLACRRCGEQLSVSRAEGSPVTYYRCNVCGMTVSTADLAALRAVARAIADGSAAQDDTEIHEWRRRLDAFTVRADQTDPFLRLGLPPDATLGEARARYHTLVMTQHPDRGGEAEELGAIVDAFDRVRDRFTDRLRQNQKAREQKTSAHAPHSPSPPRPAGAPILPRRRPESWSRWAPAQPESALAKRRQ